MMRRMTIALIGCLAVVIGFNSSPEAYAQTESIGPVIVVPGQTIDLFYDNQVIPPPNQKVLQFSGTALNPAPDVDSSLIVGFDYLDPATGARVDLVPPNMPLTIPPGTHNIDAGPWIIDFCPEQVSLHLSIADGDDLEVVGVFDHRCVVPEPCSLALAGLGSLLLLGLALRRRS